MSRYSSDFKVEICLNAEELVNAWATLALTPTDCGESGFSFTILCHDEKYGTLVLKDENGYVEGSLSHPDVDWEYTDNISGTLGSLYAERVKQITDAKVAAENARKEQERIANEAKQKALAEQQKVNEIALLKSLREKHPNV